MEGGTHECSLSYWDNYDGGPDLVVWDGCETNKTNCDTGGINTVLKQETVDPTAKAEDRPKPTEYGKDTLNRKGYGSLVGGMLTADSAKLLLTNNGRDVVVDTSREHIISIDHEWYGNSAGVKNVKYFKLFKTPVTARRRDPGTPKLTRNGGDPLPIIACTGVEIKDPGGSPLPVSASAIEVIYLNGLFVLDFGRDQFVVRLHGS